AWGVVAAYLLLTNGFVHIAWGIKFRTYNPGLWTAIFLFVPCAVWIFRVVSAPAWIHAIAAFLVIVLHAAIMVLARRAA
ncbi:MAG: HXXEE domain-containing protein, partial [Pseudomonadota bacterium]